MIVDKDLFKTGVFFVFFQNKSINFIKVNRLVFSKYVLF